MQENISKFIYIIQGHRVKVGNSFHQDKNQVTFRSVILNRGRGRALPCGRQ